MTRALGWLSVGIGLTELLAPRRLGRAIGVDAHPNLLRALGAREIASGLNILAQQRPGPGALQLRVLGDAIDLGFLAAAWASPRSDRARLATATAAVLGVTALDVLSTIQLSDEVVNDSPLDLRASVAIQRSPEELYKFWRDPSNWSRVFSHIQSVADAGETGHFRVQGRGALGQALRWDAKISGDVPNERFSWESAPGSLIAARGGIALESLGADRGTLLSVRLEFEPSASALAIPLAQLIGPSPRQLLTAELRRYKQWVETGEVSTTHGQSNGRRSLLSRHLP